MPTENPPIVKESPAERHMRVAKPGCGCPLCWGQADLVLERLPSGSYAWLRPVRS